MHSGDLIARKNEIRRKMRQLRDSLKVRCIHSKSSTVEAEVWQLIQEGQFESIMFYIAFGSEVRTQRCIIRAIDSGRTIIVPVCSSDGKRQLLPSRLLDLQSEVERGRYGIPEPKPEFRRPFPPEEIDLVVVPGLAFDERGYRIGYGAGHYDRFLARCPQALSVGLAYEMQIVECTFPATWDVPVHRIITEDRVISCHNLRSAGPQGRMLRVRRLIHK
jgi:5-formyltetrahydrofolate cyclo-ligase